MILPHSFYLDMPRVSRCRSVLSEITTSPIVGKISLLLPVLVLVIDIILIEHAIRINEHYIIFFTLILFSLSVIEIIIVISEIHENYNKNNFLKSLTIKLSDFMRNNKRKNVKILVGKFISSHPEYLANRDEIYQIICKILEEHKQIYSEKLQNNE
jgi:hypothetical protein